LEVQEAAKETVAGFPVVGIGASAGGLAAIEAFFAGMPTDIEIGMAFILVQHLAPDHKSMLSELVKRYTRMQVFEVEDGMTVKPNCVYIIPPNHDMALLNGVLELLNPVTLRGQRLTIDFFFRSLAQDQKERAICIVLSGTGSDGTQGLREVKGEGGVVMAQSPDSAEYDGMPRSAIATGMVDYILPPAEMPSELIAYVGKAFGKISSQVSLPIREAGEALKKIFILMRARTRHDFSQYKQNTLIRRIERRMAIHQVEHMDGYARYLQQTPAEVEHLFRDFLIGVTNFFRDPEAFAALEAQVIPQLFVGKSAGASIRVWVPGCSTGEEAYSIAILLQEHMEKLKLILNVQVFTTDIDRQALEKARAGVYPASIIGDISPDRSARFFSKRPGDSSYRINKGIRDMLTISEQDIIADPPFSKLDLISCRNLLIYMGGDLQKKIIPLFHYALNPDGFLFLGTSETVGEFSGLFATLDRKSKLYQSKEDVYHANRPALGRFLPQMTKNVRIPRPTGKTPGEPKLPMRELTELALLQDYAPVGALVDKNGDILYLHGRTSRYLEPAPGESGMNILKMAREGLRLNLTAALRKVVVHKKPVRRPGVRVKTNGDFTTVTLTVRSVPAGPRADAESNLFLVVFEEAPAPSTSSGQAVDPERHEKAAVVDAGESVADVEGFDRLSANALIAALRRELQVKEDNFKNSNEDMETLTEELKSTNEEIQSINEELQSTNEELETSKEELQSVNEELTTINAELQTKMADLIRVNNDMSNLMASTGIGTLFLDNQMRVQRFTPSITEVINLIPSDVGRPVGHIVSNLTGYDRLLEDVREVLDTLAPKEIEVQTKAGARLLMRIQLYRTLENAIEGAVITFVDITEIKQAQAMLQESKAQARLAVVLRDSRDCITVQDLDGRILAWNPGAERIYGWSEAEALGMNIRDLIPEGLREEALAIMQRLGQAEVLEPYRMQRIAKDGRIVEVWLIATALLNESGQIYAIATNERPTKSGTVD